MSWFEIRKELYKQVRNHVKAHLGPESTGLAKYAKEYDKEFNKKWKIASLEYFLSRVSQAEYLLLGDFHALQQSQKAQLRVLKTLPASRKVVLALECLQAVHQKHVDRYMEGKLSEKEFLKAVNWTTDWSFPWEHYKPLLRWAQKRKAKVIGINLKTKDRSAKTLAQRDKFAAELIAAGKKAHPERQMIVVYGDLHLASAHLPAQLKKHLAGFDEKAVFVYQNSEKIYFDLLKKELELQVDIVSLSKNKFCLSSVPPWVKWQNYLLYLEEQYDAGFDDELDFTDHVARYVRLIAAELSLKVEEGAFSIYSAQDTQFWEMLGENFSEKELSWFEDLIEKGESFYVPEKHWGYLARSSVNHAASLAMAIVFAAGGAYQKTPLKMPDDFLRLIWLRAVEYFGSKLINPKRKTETFSDIKIALSARQPSDRGKEALQLSLSQKMQELLALSGRTPSRKETFKPKKLSSYREAASLLGGMLGEKLYSAYRQKLLSRTTLASLLKKPLQSENFQAIYFEMIELIESFPEPFQSKTEKL